MKSLLRINRLRVYGAGQVVFDQSFHSGVNVIAGENGTGKSTIMDFIAYIIGYEEIEWKEAQKKCEYVEADIVFNDMSCILRREINDKRMNPIYIKNDSSTGKSWTVLPYRSSQDKKSFSNIFFELLDYPAAQVESGGSLTMFQLLRLIYADQNTSQDSLFNRQKEMDNKGLKKSIYEFLLGIDDLESHLKRQEKIKLDKDYSDMSAEVKAIQVFFQERDSVDIAQVDGLISDLENKIDESELAMAASRPFESNDENMAMQIVVEHMDQLTEARSKLLREDAHLELQIADSVELINVLEKNTGEIDESVKFYSLFSGLKYLYCPECLSQIEDDGRANECGLCKNVHASGESKIKSFYFERKKEIEFQWRESKKNIERRTALRQEIRLKIKMIEADIESTRQKKLVFEGISNDYGRIISEHSINIGRWQEQVKQLKSDLKYAVRLEKMKAKLIAIKEDIARLKEELRQLDASREEYRNMLMGKISAIIIGILHSDGYEDAFRQARSAQLLFEDSRMAVDGATKFSASSEAVLKLASRFSLIVASINYERVRLPRFGLIDCMEDKGMLPDRAHSVQRAMLKCLSEYDESQYQIILATSMPCEELLSSDLLVGTFMKKGQHTLNFNDN